MKGLSKRFSRKGWRATALAGVIIVQALCAVFFLADAAADVAGGEGFNPFYLVLEALAAVVLALGVIILMVELRRILARMDEMDTGLKVARGRMAEVMDGFFEDWNLTAAERDVALMILKGLDNEAISDVRQTASGTVRAQAASVYAKSGAHSRAQFISLFMEELMAGDFSAGDAAEGYRTEQV